MKYFLSRLFPAALLLNCLLPLMVFAQEAEEEVEDAVPESMSVIETIMHGGPLIMAIWVCILLVSVVLVTFMIQLALQVRNEVLAPKPLLDSLRNAIHSGNYQEAWEISKANKAYISNVLGAALERLGRGKEATEMALIDHGQRESQVYKTKNSYLSVIGVISPMIGLLGTVIGMMGAFAVLGSTGVSDPRKLALSIGEVLMATAAGLFLAIPAFTAYYYFRNRISIVVLDSDDELSRLVEDIPFAELEGIRIGEDFDPGMAAAAPGANQSRKVSMALTTNCPVCNGAIQAGQNPCPHCGATLEWS